MAACGIPLALPPSPARQETVPGAHSICSALARASPAAAALRGSKQRPQPLTQQRAGCSYHLPLLTPALLPPPPPSPLPYSPPSPSLPPLPCRRFLQTEDAIDVSDPNQYPNFPWCRCDKMSSSPWALQYNGPTSLNNLTYLAFALTTTGAVPSSACSSMDVGKVEWNVGECRAHGQGFKVPVIRPEGWIKETLPVG